MNKPVKVKVTVAGESSASDSLVRYFKLAHDDLLWATDGSKAWWVYENSGKFACASYFKVVEVLAGQYGYQEEVFPTWAKTNVPAKLKFVVGQHYKCHESQLPLGFYKGKVRGLPGASNAFYVALAHCEHSPVLVMFPHGGQPVVSPVVKKFHDIDDWVDCEAVAAHD